MNSVGLVQELAASLRTHGFDLIQAFQVQRYNTAVQEKHASQNPTAPLPSDRLMETFGRTATLGVLVGNTKAMWNPFLSYLVERDFHNAPFANPVQQYTKQVIDEALSSLGPNRPSSRVRYDFSGHPNFVDLQLLGSVSGATYYHPTTVLSIHQQFGPWVAFRAAISLDVPFEATEQQQQPVPNPVPELEGAAAEAMAIAMQHLSSPQRWIDVRNAITAPHAQEHRYTDSQLQYHYTKDLVALQEEVRRLASEQRQQAQPAV
ncbi:hypothetical protein CAOG_06117 [Capsaspora owczarzaki ATCC 30864]|uniref:Cyanocobalamin reductase (cyanide-eliminating) n=1 Tax=Capsaspora owczarzaki (strain ATCC 30864) TaxID=595528 RepID=A0A0D2WTD6_CAPO3|nr:hypothetical protein CAOG_06117 [Capsaspora owczarzaki ATCC 30864]KJE95690.1 hypothetical protein CAOG_006117 [Capsaspora owczarzaki ATCC 30864]|eukprot:XP_004345707.1 hypothetical protein CAOG_06117 [Capsaspora owczarzaki ATCC 30864]